MNRALASVSAIGYIGVLQDAACFVLAAGIQFNRFGVMRKRDRAPVARFLGRLRRGYCYRLCGGTQHTKEAIDANTARLFDKNARASLNNELSCGANLHIILHIVGRGSLGKLDAIANVFRHNGLTPSATLR